MSRTPIGSALALAASAVLLVSLAATAAPPEDKPDKPPKAETRLGAKAERKTEQQARAEARAEARAAKQAARVTAKAERKAAKAEAKELKQAAKAERKQAEQKPEKVRLCHKPDTPDEVTITVGAPAGQAHQAHGDYLGECGAPEIVVSLTGTSAISPGERLRLVSTVTGTTLTQASFVWSSTCFTEAQLVDPSVIASRPSTSTLVIREGMMSGGATCGFTLAVTDEETGRVGTDSVEVSVNAPPEGGSITVTPSAGGIALVTLFHLEASGWTDPDEPLYYRFSYVPAGSTDEIALTPILPVGYADVYLPAGDLEVSASVFDSLGAVSSASTVVTVLEP